MERLTRFTMRTVVNGITAVLLAGGCATATSALAAPISVTPIDGVSVTPAALANSLLGSGSGIIINSVTYTGANGASGAFTNGAAIGIPSGVLLTTGTVNNVPGPNTSPSASLNNGQAGSALLSSQIGGASTFNAATLAIKFTPAGNNINFSYVFGSEEYNEFLNFNDVFGLFVNGINFALVPGTSTPVSVSNVNCGPSGVGSGPNCAFFINNPVSADVQLDGFTQVLSLIAPVNNGVENTLTLAIADAGDTALDSAVFIAGGTLSVCGGPNQPPCGGTPVPEPATLALLSLGLLGVTASRRKSAKKKTL